MGFRPHGAFFLGLMSCQNNGQSPDKTGWDVKVHIIKKSEFSWSKLSKIIIIRLVFLIYFVSILYAKIYFLDLVVE